MKNEGETHATYRITDMIRASIDGIHHVSEIVDIFKQIHSIDK